MTDLLQRIRMRLMPRRGIVGTVGGEQLERVWTASGRPLLPPPKPSDLPGNGDVPSTPLNESWYSDFAKMPRLFTTDPAEIEFISDQFQLPKAPFGEAFFVEGDWDRNHLPIDEGLDFLASFQQFLGGTPWPQTPYYQRRIRALSRKLALKRGARYHDSQGLDEYLGQIEKVFSDMRENGYRVLSNQNQIYVNIDRDGRLLLHDGRHRFAFARILGFDRIPVAIRFVHTRWLAAS